MLRASLRYGFTIVELLIVIVVIGILAALVVSVYTGAQQRARMASVENDFAVIKKSMLAYKASKGELPPTGDFCNHCGQTVPTSAWVGVLNAMRTEGVLGATGPTTDPWGNYYAYDDNDCNSNEGITSVWSLGPDGVKNTADDMAIVVSRGCATT